MQFEHHFKLITEVMKGKENCVTLTLGAFLASEAVREIIHTVLVRPI